MPHSRYIMVETLIAIVLNIIVSAVFVFIMFGGMEKIGLWGTAGLALDLVPTVFMITLMTTIALTLIARSRIAAGTVLPDQRPSRLPANPVLRGLVLAVVATVLIVSVSVAILSALWPVTGDWSFTAVLVFKCAFSAALAIAVTPVIVRHALRIPAG